MKTLMKVCCASKNHANETRVAWNMCVHPKSPMQCSIVSSRVDCFRSSEISNGGMVSSGSVCERSGFGSGLLIFDCLSNSVFVCVLGSIFERSYR